MNDATTTKAARLLAIEAAIRVFGDDYRCRVCSVCEDGNGQSGVVGGHHWLDQCLDLDDLDADDIEDYAGPIFAGVDVFMSCKHCPAWTPDWEAIHDFDEMED
jgi:hypothetical protein